MTYEQLQARIQELEKENRRLIRSLRDWFIGMALSGAAVESNDEAQVTVNRAIRIADAVMRGREKL